MYDSIFMRNKFVLIRNVAILARRNLLPCTLRFLLVLSANWPMDISPALTLLLIKKNVLAINSINVQGRRLRKRFGASSMGV